MKHFNDTPHIPRAPRHTVSNGALYAFWFLNHRLEAAELRRQLRALKAKGFAGVFPHPRGGLLTPYLSRAWFDCIRLIARECRRLGLEFWLYDEDPFPSGAGGGRVMLDHPEFARHELVFEEHKITSTGAEFVLDFQNVRLIAAFALSLESGRTMRIVGDLTSDCGVVRQPWVKQRRTTNGYYRPHSEAGREHWRTGTAGVNWRLQTRLPPGRYLVAGIFAQRQENNTWGGLPDLLNPAAVKYFMEITHERYRRELGADLFRTVRGIFTDEAKVTGAFPWTDALPEHFQREYGTAFLPLLPHLKYELNARTPLIRHQYRQLLGQMFRLAFVRPIFDWCARYGMQSTGHFSPEENPIGQQAMTPDLMGWLKDMQLPGTDLIGSNIGTRKFSVINLGPKLVSSAARQAGRAEVLSESLGVSGEDLSLARAKAMLDWQMVLGVNKFVLHGQFYSLDGPRKREAPPSIFESAPYWPYFNKFADYIESTCRRLRQGRKLGGLAVLYPTAHINAALPDGEARLAGWRRRLSDLVYELLAHGLDFDFVAEPDLALARHDAMGLRIGRCVYKALVVPEVAMLADDAAAVLKRLRIPVFFTGVRPRLLGNQRVVTHVGRLCRPAALPEVLTRLITPPLRTCSGQDMFCHSRMVGRQIRHFVFNPTNHKLNCELVTASGQWLDQCDEQTGQFQGLSAGNTGRPTIVLPALGAAFLKESAHNLPANLHAAARNANLHAKRKNATLALAGPWRLMPAGDNTLLLDQWQTSDGQKFRLPLPADAVQLPAQPVLRCRFMVKHIPQTARLVWEAGTFTVPYILKLNARRLTGTRRRVYDARNLVADAAPFLRVGWNVLEVRFEAAGAPPMQDPLRLMGKFAVMPRGRGFVVDEWRGMVPVRKLADWARMGWPFYSGTVVYETEFDLPRMSTGACVRLRLAGVHDLAAVTVNGRPVDVLAWPPYQCDIKSLVRPGRNHLALRVANSFINFIDGELWTSGITGKVELLMREYG